MHSLSLLTALLAATVSTTALPAANPWQGINGQRGNLIALHNGKRAGCVTPGGLLTLNDANCGDFYARRTAPGSATFELREDDAALRCAARSKNSYRSFACTTTATPTTFAADGRFLVNPATGDLTWLAEALPADVDPTHFYSELGGQEVPLRIQWKTV